MTELETARIEIEDLKEDLKAEWDNASALIQCQREALEQLFEAIGIPRGKENWDEWIAKVRAEISQLRGQA
jgi:hypothetical protein